MNKKRMAIMLAVSGVVFGGVFGFVQFRNKMIADYFASMGRPVVAVTAQAARLENWSSRLTTIGTLEAINGVQISVPSAGLVEQILFQSGQTVKRGQMLLRLDSGVENSNLRSAQADADLAKVSANRQRSLIRSEVVSQAAVDKAEAELKAKGASAAAIRAQIDRRAVFAPFDGVLGVRKIDLGQYIQPGDPIVSLQDLSVMLANFAVSQKDLSALHVGGAVRLTTDAWPDKVFDGTITVIEPLIDEKTGMVRVQASFPNGDGMLRPGLFVKLDVQAPSTLAALTVPTTAIAYNLHGDAVYVVKTDDKGGKQAERIYVRLGERRGDRVAVLNGLSEGDLVVTSGQVKLDQGSPVDVRPDNPLKQQ